MADVDEKVQEALESAGESKMNRWIALLVAVAATIMALGNVKDGNIVQAMAQAQANAVDRWTFYQAKSTKQNIAEQDAARYEVQLADPALRAEVRDAAAAQLERLRADAKRYGSEKDEIKAKAEGFEKEYDALNVHDDQFDMAEACLTVAIALLGVTALTRQRWLFVFGTAMMIFGSVMTAAGFFGWNLHPDWLAKLFG
jgi:hypothetical protein